jgi:hypothetical protein
MPLDSGGFFLANFEPNNKPMAISSNEIKIKYVIDDTELKKAVTSFDNLSKEEQDAVSELKKFNRELNDTSTKATETGNKLSGAFDKAQGGIGGMMNKLGPLGPMIAGAFTITAVVGFGKAIFDVTARFEKLAAVLKNTLGSGAQASLALEGIKEFAKTTPFSVEELTASFVKLANQGFKPTTEEMRKLGDLASSTGKNFDMLTEAIIDAQVGEFERLKEFGIRAQKAGDQVTFTFKGVQTQTKFTNEAIREYILSLGDYEGVAGAAAAVSGTLGGQVNNLGDAWDNFLNKIGTLLKPILTDALVITADFMDSINKLFGNAQSDAERFATTELTAFQFYQQQMLKMTDDQLDEFVKKQKDSLKTSTDDLIKYSAIANKATSLERAAAADFGTGSAELIQAMKIIEQSNLDIANYKGRIAAAEEQIKLRTENSAKTAKQLADAEKQRQADAEKARKAAEKAEKERVAAEKQNFQDRLQLLNLEKEQRKLLGELRGDPTTALAAEKIYEQQVYDLKKEFLEKKIGLKQIEVDNAELSAQAAAKAYEDAVEKEKLTAISLTDFLAKENAKREEDDKKLFDSRLAAMKKFASQYESTYKEAIDKEIKKYKEAEEIKAASIELGNQLVAGAFQLYSQSIDREITLLNKRANAEIALADGNQQKIDQINQEKAVKEKELKEKAWRAERDAAIARVVFETAAIIAKWTTVNPILAAITLTAQAAQIGFIMAQKVPEFAEGTKGKPFEGGLAMVGEKGVEKVVTKSGKVYFTPPTATLVDLPKGSQVIPNSSLSKQEVFWANRLSGGQATANPMVGKLDELGSILKSLPITQLNMDERGFEKYIRTERRTTKILNNRFRSSQ